MYANARDYLTRMDVALDLGTYGEDTRVGFPFVDFDDGRNGGSDVLDGGEGERMWADLSGEGWLGAHKYGQDIACAIFRLPTLLQRLEVVARSNKRVATILEQFHGTEVDSAVR